MTKQEEIKKQQQESTKMDSTKKEAYEAAGIPVDKLWICNGLPMC